MVVDYVKKNDLDILFLQEAGPIDWFTSDFIKNNYDKIKGKDSIILFRKNKFGGPR